MKFYSQYGIPVIPTTKPPPHVIEDEVLLEVIENAGRLLTDMLGLFVFLHHREEHYPGQTTNHPNQIKEYRE